jgi:hypothetical protein
MTPGRRLDTGAMVSPERLADAPTLPVTVETGLAPEAPPSGWERWWRRTPRTPDRELPRARQDFADSLADLPAHEVLTLRRLLEHARSLRELWYLRPEVFRCVALHRSEHEARRRLAGLNRHFARPGSPDAAQRPR